MKYYGQKSIPQRLVQAEEVITNVAIDEYLRTRLASTGYAEDEFVEVQQLLENAQLLETNQQVQLGKQTAATNELKVLTQAIRLKFVGDRRVVRFVLKDNISLYEELRLQINTKNGREALLRQMQHFYEEVVKHEALIAQLTDSFNLTAELFASRLQEVAALFQAIQVQRYQIAQVRVATRDRQDAMQLLDDWMSAFIGVARQTFRKDEENLKKLQIFTQPKSRSVIPPAESDL